MIKNLLMIVFTALIFATPSSALAQTVTTAPDTTASTTVTPTTTQRNKASSVGQAAREKAMVEKEAFKERLAEIKDAKKKTLVEKIDSNIQSINERRTAKMSEYLDKLSGVLERVSSKEASLKAAGKNTTTLVANITAAETAISRAQTAVDAQAEKVYTANITTDALLKSSVSSIISQFRTDIIAVFNLVKAARVSVFNAFTEAKKLENGKAEETATPSATTE